MNKASKKSLKAILALILTMNMTGCGLFGGDDEDDSKESVNKHQDVDKKDEDNKKDEDKDKDTDSSNDNVADEENDEQVIQYTGGTSYKPFTPSQTPTTSHRDDKPSQPTKPDVIVKTDFTQLRSLIAEYKNMDVTAYTPKSVSTFKNAIVHAEKILNTTSASQSTVNKEIKVLQNAKNQLVLIADFTELTIQLKKAENIKEEKYTPNSISALNQEIVSAKKVLNDKNSSQKNVDTTTNLLKEKIESLILRADFTQLEETIKTANQIKDADYTDDSLAPMYQSLTKAKNVLKNLNASQSTVDNANKDLINTLKALVKYIAPDTTELNTLLVKAKEYKENEYSVSSYSTLKSAITYAEKILGMKKVTESQVNSAKNQLQQAIDGLSVDTLNLMVEFTKAKLIDETVYTPKSYKVLKDVIDETEVFLETQHKQYEIDAQTKTITTALNQLVKRADKKDLEQAINNAKSKYDGDYTEITLNALKQAVSDAELVYNDFNATQDEVSNATKEVNDAIKQLKVVIHKEKLQEAIDKTKDVKEDEYTPNSYATFKLAYDNAVSVNTNENATQEQVDTCTTTLETAFNNLVKRADFRLLNQKISDANAINQDYYTDASLVDFIKELANAKELVKDLNTTQDDVDQQLTSLTNSMDSLVAYVAPNLDAINQVISNAEKVKDTDWSLATYATMKEKLELAKEVINKRKVTQEEINQAKDELLSAYNALSVDVSALKDKLDNAKIYQEINYTLDSFKTLQDAITHTENFLKETHTQSEINTEVSSLQSAIDQLVLFHEADKTSLILAINNAKAIQENDYTPNSYSVLANAITNAESVNDNYRATVDEINTAINAIDSAKANLMKRANTTALNQAITDTKAKYDDGYTTSSIDALKEVIATSEAVLNNANASQSDVDSQTNAIQQAINNLIKLGDKNALSNLIDELEALNENDYTPVSWASASLGIIINDAKVIRDKTEATETEVNNALDELTQAKAKLVKKADITELTSEITKAKTELSKGYTTQSLADLNTAITNAETVKDNVNASATDVSNALSTLKNAINNLKIDVTPLVQEINTSKSVDTNGKKPSTVTALNNAILEAETLKDDSSITFEKMNTMIQKLKDAVSGLKDQTDTSALQAKVDEVKALDKNDYTLESYSQLEIVLQEAITALANEDITTDEVNKMIQKLETAIDNLEYVPTVASKRKELEKIISDANTLLNDTSIQTPKQYKDTLVDRVDITNQLLGFSDEELTLEEMQQAIDLLNKDIKAYTDNQYDVQGMITQAQAKVAEFKALNPDDYSTNSYFTANYYCEILEGYISTGVYEDIKAGYDWFVEEMENLEPRDTNVYVNEQAPGEVLALLNAERKAQGLGELTLDSTLCQATTIRATEAQYQTGEFADWAHKRPDGRSWATVLDEVGFSTTYFGENAARGQASGESLYSAWYNSPLHKENMMNPEFTKVGISMIKVGERSWVSYMILSN